MGKLPGALDPGCELTLLDGKDVELGLLGRLRRPHRRA
jgi:hypothetical protein